MRRWWANLGFLNQNSQTRQQNLGPNVGFHKNWSFWSPYLCRGLLSPVSLPTVVEILLVGRKKDSTSHTAVEPQLLKNILIIFYVVIEPTHLKDMIVKMGIFPQIGMNIKKIFELPPARYLVHLAQIRNLGIFHNLPTSKTPSPVRSRSQTPHGNSWK